jgi:hypothetical protein
MDRKLDTATVLERMLDAYRAQAALFLPAALVVFVPLAIVVALTRGRGAGTGVAVLAAVLGLIANFAYQGIVVEAVRDIQDGVRDFTVGGVLRTVAPALGPLIVVAILTGIGLAIGFVALVIPFLVLLAWWALVVPVVVIERPPVLATFGRSRELVRGNGWRVFGIVVVLIVIQQLLAQVLGTVAVGALGDRAGNAVAGLVVNVFVAPLSAIATTLMFLDLRRMHGDPPVPAHGEDPPGRAAL